MTSIIDFMNLSRNDALAVLSKIHREQENNGCSLEDARRHYEDLVESLDHIQQAIDAANHSDSAILSLRVSRATILSDLSYATERLIDTTAAFTAIGERYKQYAAVFDHIHG